MSRTVGASDAMRLLAKSHSRWVFPVPALPLRIMSLLLMNCRHGKGLSVPHGVWIGAGQCGGTAVQMGCFGGANSFPLLDALHRTRVQD